MVNGSSENSLVTQSTVSYEMSFSGHVLENSHKILLDFCSTRLVSLRKVFQNTPLRRHFVTQNQNKFYVIKLFGRNFPYVLDGA